VERDSVAVNLADAGVPVTEFIQGIRSYTAPIKELLAWLLEGKLDHGGNPVLAWMAGNMHTSLPDKNDNVMPSKKHRASTG
jgi:phage terminase large subunit-like protein